jgi:hypothetical protein
MVKTILQYGASLAFLTLGFIASHQYANPGLNEIDKQKDIENYELKRHRPWLWKRHDFLFFFGVIFFLLGITTLLWAMKIFTVNL